MAPALREDASGATVAVDIAIAVVIGAEADALEGGMVVAGIVGTQNGDVVTVGCAIVDGPKGGPAKVMVLPDTLITVFVTGAGVTVDRAIAVDNVAEEAGSEAGVAVDGAIVADNVAEEAVSKTGMVVDGVIAADSVDEEETVSETVMVVDGTIAAGDVAEE
ncbi:hypothetical protein, partial [Endozoicomonas acroporae]|uniref:hypothetical protein n=1 Tax=Endozoicomonas acroporae TaxID=1701104 RepID=UPI003D7B38CC